MRKPFTSAHSAVLARAHEAALSAGKTPTEAVTASLAALREYRRRADDGGSAT